MISLSVNLNKIALLRNARGADTPSVVGAARTVLDNGGQGITVHPRPDMRHIRPFDVTNLATLLADEYPQIEFNIEGNPFAGATTEGYPGFDALIAQALPAQATLVPDSDDQLTSDHGFDLRGDNSQLQQKIALYQSLGCRVSLFMDPDLEQIQLAKQIGADRIELYTGPFADAVNNHGLTSEHSHKSLAEFTSAAQQATQLGLGVNAGHDLDQVNLQLFRTITEVQEVSIGHALISDALDHGLAATVRSYLAVIQG